MSVSLFSRLLPFDCAVPSTDHCLQSCHVLCIQHLFFFYGRHPLCITKCGISTIAVKEAHTTVPALHYGCEYVCVCVWLANGAALTRHISLMELQSVLLSLYASQASVCSRSNSSFVTLKLMLRGWNFSHRTHRALFKQHGSQTPLEMLC